VDAYAAHLPEVRQHGVQTCYFDSGLVTPTDLAWVYVDGSEAREALVRSGIPDLLGHLAMGMLVPADKVGDLRVRKVSAGGWNRVGLVFNFPYYLQCGLRLNGHVDIGEIAPCPVEDLFREAGRASAYQPFRLFHLMRLLALTASERKEAEPVQANAHRGRHRPPKGEVAVSQTDFWLPRMKRLRPTTVLDVLQSQERGVHGYGKHWVPGYFRPLRAGETVSKATTEIALKEQLRAPGPCETYVRGHWHCQQRTGVIASHRARPTNPI
jgi:hypothetical protein